MKKSKERNAFNDGEVVIQQVSSTSITKLTIPEESENTEELTIKLSPFKPKARAAAFKGLGKCTRVAVTRGKEDTSKTGCHDSDDSDNEKEADHSSYIRAQKKVAVLPRFSTRSTSDTGSTGENSVVAKPIRNPVASVAVLNVPTTTSVKEKAKKITDKERTNPVVEATVLGVTTANVTTANITTNVTANSSTKDSLKSTLNVTKTRTKTFVMDNEMKNFNPLDWRKLQEARLKSQQQSVKIVDNDINLCEKSLSTSSSSSASNIQTSSSTDNNVHNKAVPTKASTNRSTSSSSSNPSSSSSSIASSKPSSNPDYSSSDDDNDDQETCPLDISLCETKEIPIISKTKEDIPNPKSTSKSNPNPVSRKRDNEKANDSKDKEPSMNDVKNDIKNGVKGDSKVDNKVESKRRKRVSFAGNENENKVKNNEKNEKIKDMSMGHQIVTKQTNDDKDNGRQEKKMDKQVVLTLNGNHYTRLTVLGKGGSSCVYRVMSQNDSQLYAYKRVEVKGNSEDSDAIFDSYVNEIELLKRLKGTSPYIIDLIDAEVDREEMYIAIVMEAGEVDLAKVLSQKQRQALLPLTLSPRPQTELNSKSSNSSSKGTYSNGTSSSSSADSSNDKGEKGDKKEVETKELINPFFARMIWQEMLEAVDHIHNNRIVHGDLKPANFVFVKGHLKLIDFGIAKAISNDTTNIYRESQIGTVNYMAPEAIAPYSVEGPGSGSGGGGSGGHFAPDSEKVEREGISMRLGRASDIWSLGCILYQIHYGRPPFAALTTIQKLHAIPSDKYVIQYPENDGYSIDKDAIATMKACLERDPRKRATIRGDKGLLSMAYLSIKAMKNGWVNDTNFGNAIINVPREISRDTVKQIMALMKEEQSRQVVRDNSSKNNDRICENIWIAVNNIKNNHSDSSASGTKLITTSNDIDSDVGSEEETVREEIIIPKKSIPTSNRTSTSNSIPNYKDFDSNLSNSNFSLKLATIDKENKIQNNPNANPNANPNNKSEINKELFGYKEKTSDTLPIADNSSKKRSSIEQRVAHPENIYNIYGNPNKSVDTLSGSDLLESQKLQTLKLRENLTKDIREAGNKRKILTLIPENQNPSSQTSFTSSSSQINAVINKNSATSNSTSNTVSNNNENQNSKKPFLRNKIGYGDNKPLRTLPMGLQEQILAGQRALENTSTSNSDKWMKPKGKSPEKNDLKSVIEKRIGAMRKFLDEEQDHTATGTIDFTDGNSFF